MVLEFDAAEASVTAGLIALPGGRSVEAATQLARFLGSAQAPRARQSPAFDTRLKAGCSEGLFEWAGRSRLSSGMGAT
jgi:hypothetical protein